jgi:hypothetical protein
MFMLYFVFMLKLLFIQFSQFNDILSLTIHSKKKAYMSKNIAYLSTAIGNWLSAYTETSEMN